ncbi:Crossover junction endonuclease EME1B [Zea mays]|uniref:Crossover junction endonuclease EME1B n=1 Tax=Zea mays TaxID=4577 RepID=A0A1D6DW56_MAIZE|nr:Crossover junction endonuclease EME1B [Zea mays]
MDGSPPPLPPCLAIMKPLTWLSVQANGAVIPKGFVHKDLAKKDTWLKALIAIPDIQPRYAFAIWKKYPCMRSLLNEYMDGSKTVAEKELLLSDLKWEDRLGDEGKRLGNKCSRRVYRMLMAQNGDLDADDPEAGGRS